MKIFGFDISRDKGAKAVASAEQLNRPSQSQGQWTSTFETWIARKVNPSLYEALREAIPVCDVAILRMVSLDGLIRFDGANKGLVHEIEDWAESVQVNDLQVGLQAFINNFSNETYEQGFSISEFVTSPGADDIIRLNVADSKDIAFVRPAAGPGMEIWYRGRSVQKKSQGTTELMGDILSDNLSSEGASRLNAVKLKPDNLIYYSIDNENHGPYGVSILRSTEFVTKILLTIQNGVLNSWERFGDPSYHISYKTSKRDLGEKTLDDRVKALTDKFKTAIAGKRLGKSADFFTAVDKDSDVVVKVIGADGQVLEIEQPARHVLEQIVARTKLPSWLLGFHWATTERLAQFESEILLQEALTRGENKLPSIKRLIAMMLRMRGRTWKRDDWEVTFDLPNLHDLVAQAQARFLNAQADMYDRQGGPAQATPPQKRARVKLGSCECGSKGLKESRPVAFPELDRVEQEFEGRLKDGWSGLKERFFIILKLRDPGKEAKAPGDLPGADKFTFTPEQRARVMQAMRDWVGEWKPESDNTGALEWYYGQSYSLGLLQAARMIGNQRPVLDVIKNSGIFMDLVDNGFALVKDNATEAIVNRILPEMEAQVIAGTNPVHVANRLSGIFGDANSNWERLARSEMTMAAERAKIDEAKANGITRMEFVAAPDACPICQAIAGEYDIAECPVPVRDTHPRCYCTTATIVS